MKKFFTVVGVICTCVLLYWTCEALLEDDNETTDEYVDEDYDDDDEYYDDDDEYYDEDDDEDYDDKWTVAEKMEEMEDEFDMKDSETSALVESILAAFKEDGDEIKTTKPAESAKPAAEKPAATPAKPAEKPAKTPSTKPAEEKKAATPAKPAEEKKAATPAKPANEKPAATTATNRKVKSITGADYKAKLADYTASKTNAKKGANGIVLVYLPSNKKCNEMVESMNKLANEFPNLDLYTTKLQECVDLAKAYAFKELPVLIVVRNGKVELHTGYLKTESLREFLKKY